MVGLDLRFEIIILSVKKIKHMNMKYETSDTEKKRNVLIIIIIISPRRYCIKTTNPKKEVKPKPSSLWLYLQRKNKSYKFNEEELTCV